MDTDEVDHQSKTASTDVDLAASPDDVWRALTTEDGLADWMGPDSTIDVQPGGELELTDIVGGHRRHGRVGRVEDGERLDFVWWPETDPSDWSTVSFVLSPTDAGTHLTVTETAPQTQPGAVTSMTLSATGSTPPSGGQADWAWRHALLTIRCTSLRPAGALLAH